MKPTTMSLRAKSASMSIILIAAVAACGSTRAATSTTSATTSTIATSLTSASVATTTQVSADTAITNTWLASTVDPKILSIGDAFVSTTEPAAGTLWACNAGHANAGGASADGPWLNIAAGTWDSTAKLAVEGSVGWPQAKYTETVDATSRTLTSNDLPVDGQTGTFPIAATDPSYAYDRNPGSVKEQSITKVLTATPTVASSPSCLPEGAVGMLKNGVQVFSSLDGRNDDAVAHESQDLCQGHPAMTTYHYHNVPSCIRNAAPGSSTVVGFALDGFPIVVERNASGALPTNADLDQCHGRTSDIILDGKKVTMYHYSATLEFPYFIGCYAGTPLTGP